VRRPQSCSQKQAVSAATIGQRKLSALVSKQLSGDADAVATAIERLTDSLGLAIAVSCGGEISQADDMMTGVDGYLAECVANHAKLAQFMACTIPPLSKP
jgi:hypothetical protein